MAIEYRGRRKTNYAGGEDRHQWSIDRVIHFSLTEREYLELLKDAPKVLGKNITVMIHDSSENFIDFYKK